MINLDNFETQIDRKIVDRGFSYYEGDDIVEFEKVSKYEFRGYIQGTRYYTTIISLDKKKNIKNAVCNCPFNYGPYCKHIVAMFYYIADLEAYKEDYDKSGSFNLLVENLKEMKKSDLLRILKRACLTNRSLLNHLLLELGEEDNEYIDFDDYY